MQNYQYKIIATKYREDGALTAEQEVQYRDAPEQAYRVYKEFDCQKYTDVEGNPTGIKKYNVEILTSAYKAVDIAGFAAMYDLR